MSQAVKTKKKSRASREGWVSDFFAAAKGSLVPVKPKQKVDPALERTLTTVQSEEVTSTAIRVSSTRAREVTTPSRLQAARGLKTSRPSATQVPEKNERNRKIGLVLLSLMIGLIGYGLIGVSESEDPSSNQPKYDRAKIQERVNYHRQQTGMKLNSDRINTEFESMATAPSLPLSVKKVPAPNMMEGVPLAAEPIHRKSSRDRLMPTNPDYPDARVMYGLQEEQAANEWEDEARKKYVDEFVQRAAAAGYRVRVDDDYNVTVRPGRRPQSSGRSADFESGMSQ